MKNSLPWLLLFYLLVSNTAGVLGQSLQHPAIWVTEEERPLILQKIKKYRWAKSIVEQWHEHVDQAKAQHASQPELILNAIPELGGNQGRHNAVLTLASESGMLYFLTKDESYAQLSADIIAAYSARLATRTPKTTEIMGDAFYDGRTTYDQFGLAYDFVYHFLKDPKTRVYDVRKRSRVRFDFAASQKAIKNVAGNILQEYGKPDKHGRLVSNHPVLTAPGALFPLLCVEDDTERERLFKVFWDKGTHHQASFQNTLMRMYSKQGIWPESYSYSFQSNMIMILNIVDRLKPQMNVTKNAEQIFEGTLVLANLNNPDGRSIRYGDSKRKKGGGAGSLRYIMHLSDRRAKADWKLRSAAALKQIYESNGGYKPNMSNSVYNNYRALQLFWGIDIPDSIRGSIDYRTTVLLDHAGIAMQRNFVEKDNERYGLNAYIGGAHYVHSHCTGIAMELYGAGYVMGPNGGLPRSTRQRNDPVHTDYYRLYAGNNTVVTNGTSHGRGKGSWKSKANVWQNTAVNIAVEPEHMEAPISEQFCFATQSLKDEVNECRQQRTLSVIRTSETTGYYFDVFRATSNEKNRFHDYIYHNLGDETRLTDGSGKKLSVSPTDRYDNDIGDIVHSPGWRYFEDEKATKSTDAGAKIQFHVARGDRYMNMFVPAGVKHEYTTALAPPTREAINGYDKKKTQVVAIRKQGEAWKKPFVTVFEPSTNREPSIQHVGSLIDRGQRVGAMVVSNVGRSRITDFIISHDTSKGRFESEKYALRFKGRFAVVRVEEPLRRSMSEELDRNPERAGSKLTFYLGNGSSLSWRDVTVKSKSGSNTAALVEFANGKAPQVTAKKPVEVLGVAGSAQELSGKSQRKTDGALAQRTRLWTDKSGKFSLQATLVGVKQGRVALKKANGSVVILSLGQLSSEDNDVVQKLIEKYPKLLYDE